MSGSECLPSIAVNSLSCANFQQYLAQIHSFPMLTESEELELFQRYKNHNDLQAVHRIIMSHLRLVASIAKQYLGYGLAQEDLIQEGSVGLMKSIKRYDLSFGVRLASFASYWIKSEIVDYIVKNWRIVKIAFTKAQRKLFFRKSELNQHGNSLSESGYRELSEKLRVDINEVKTMEMRLRQQDCFIDPSQGEDACQLDAAHQVFQSELSDTSACPEAHLIKSNFNQVSQLLVRDNLLRLPERTREIIQRRWLVEPEEQESLKTLAEEYGISIERVRQIERSGLDMFRQAFIKHNLSGD